MTFMQCFIRLLPLVLGVIVLFAIIYPASCVIIHKLCGSKLAVREILKRI